ncbi:hypothetical protein NDU88_003351 [Pleurodeles waltl]|uniref:Uncharacterized protein n=1 Tax=Pleurodeles waltl TaxID=8319 RepID=A0AAV7MVC9_PLEWA|nr:hypothetical protein NDU88_003351 [Pleurodeles waltl]
MSTVSLIAKEAGSIEEHVIEETLDVPRKPFGPQPAETVSNDPASKKEYQDDLTKPNLGLLPVSVFEEEFLLP